MLPSESVMQYNINIHLDVVQHEGALHALASALLEHETLSSKQITQVLSPFQQTDIIETTEAEVPS